MEFSVFFRVHVYLHTADRISFSRLQRVCVRAPRK